jgi:dTDP-4-amino-4,6-dideoxygalactose transaminase
MNIPLVDLKAQYLSIKDEIDAVIQEVISKTAFIGGSYVKVFEDAFAEFCGTKHCIGVGHGTDALFISLKCLGIGPGDEVFVPANSFIATSEAVTMTGARVAFVDIDPRTYNMDPNHLEYLLKRKMEKREGSHSPKPGSARPKAIVPVHLYGQPADMDPIMELAKKNDLRVVEDCAQAHGAAYKGRKIGTIGDAACFSFFPGKNLGAYGDGGAVITRDDDLALKVRMIANHGRIGKYDHNFEGVNSRLDALQAAILSTKLRYLEGWTESRREKAYRYNEALRGVDLATPFEIENVRAVYHLYVIRVKDELRGRLQDHLRSMGIATGIHYPIALPNLTAYAYLGHSKQDFPEASAASHQILSLPMFPEFDEEQIMYVAGQIKTFGL